MNKKVGSKVNALRYYQKTTESLIPKLWFEKLVGRIAPSIGNDFDYQLTTLDALQKSYEKFVVRLFGKLENKNKKFKFWTYYSFFILWEDIKLFCTHAKRVTVMPKDMALARKLLEY